MLIAIAAPPDNARSPQFMERVFTAILASIDRRDEITLEYGKHEGNIGLFCRFSDRLEHQVIEHLSAKYPNCSIEKIAESALNPSPDQLTWSASLSLSPEIFPILRHRQFLDIVEGSIEDPLESLLGVIQPDEDLHPRIRIRLRPAGRWLPVWARGAMKRLDRSFFRSHPVLADLYARFIMRSWLAPFAFLLGLLAATDRYGRNTTDATASRYGDREDDLQAAADKIGGNLCDAQVELLVSAQREHQARALTKLHTIKGAFGSFTKARLATFRMSGIRRGRPRRRWFYLSQEELATLFHPATHMVQSDRTKTTPFTELEAPVDLASGKEEGSVVIGHVSYKRDARPFGITQDDRRRHLYVVGKSGMGKTTLLKNLIRSDIDAGVGVAVIDPHGDLADDILDAIPSHRTNDVILLDPADSEYSVSFNPLACADPSRHHLLASGFVSSFKKMFDSWGPRLEDTLRNAAFVASEQGGGISTVMKLLTDEAFRLRTACQIHNTIAYDFWNYEFPSWNDRYRTEATGAIMNKLRPYVMCDQIRAIVAQKGRSLDLRQAMDEGKILIVKLSKGLIGEDNMQLFGSLFVSKLQVDALTRQDVAEEQRRDFHVYIDEFQNFSSGAFATMFSEARKYRTTLTVAHQYLDQLDEETADSVFGNVGSMICFQVGHDDAFKLARQLSKVPDQVKPEDVGNIPHHHAYMRLLHKGMPGHPFSFATSACDEPATKGVNAGKVRSVSNQRYARKRADVLAELDADRISPPGPSPVVPARLTAGVAFSGTFSSS